MPHRKHITSTFLAIGMVGCSVPTTYYWGNYDDVLYSKMTKPDAMSLEEQIELLEQDIANAEKKGLKIHPGLYAELGTSYYKMGNSAKALYCYEKEKELFPESTVFINRLIEGIER